MKRFVSISVCLCIFVWVGMNQVCLDTPTTLPKIVNKLEKTSAKSLASMTFADPVVIVDNRNGKILQEFMNHVIAKLQSGDNFFRNPLNHCGRQAASWYWENKKTLNLPEAKDLTIISSVDNCIMCTGAILASGLNVGSISVSKGATTNSDGTGIFQFYKSSPDIYTKITSTTGYYAIENDPERTTYTGLAQSVAFKNQVVSATSAASLGMIFGQTMPIVNQIEADSYAPVADLLNFRNLNAEPRARSKTLQALLQLDPKSQSSDFPTMTSVSSGNIDKKLQTHLEDLVAKTPGAQNAVALIDTFGNVMLTQVDTFDVTPFNNAFYNLITKYYNLRFQLISEASVNTNHGFKESEPFKYLPAPRNCQFVFLFAPGGNDAISLNIFGAYFFVSDVANGTGPKIVFINDPKRGTIEETRTLITKLPAVNQITTKSDTLVKAIVTTSIVA